MTEEEAISRLTEAIEEYASFVAENGILMDWILVTHSIRAEDHGMDQHSTGYIGSERQPNYRSLGLVEYASTTIRAEIESNLRGE